MYVTDAWSTMCSLQEQIVFSRAVATLVRRPEHGRWLVPHMSDHMRPEKVPPRL